MLDSPMFLTCFDDFWKNCKRLIECSEKENLQFKSLLQYINESYDSIKNLKTVNASLVQEKSELENVLLEKVKKIESLEVKLNEYADLIDFVSSILAQERSCDGMDEPPKSLSENSVRQLWRVQSFRQNSQQFCRINSRDSLGSLTASEDMDKDFDNRPSLIQRPVSPPGVRISGGESPADLKRFVHWAPGKVLASSNFGLETCVNSSSSGFQSSKTNTSNFQINTNNSALEENSDDGMNTLSCQKSRKRCSRDSFESYSKHIPTNTNSLKDFNEISKGIVQRHRSSLEARLSTINQSKRQGRLLSQRHEWITPHGALGLVNSLSQFCYACGKRLHFGKRSLKCQRCRIYVHYECKRLCMAGPPCLPPLSVSCNNDSIKSPVGSKGNLQCTKYVDNINYQRLLLSDWVPSLLPDEQDRPQIPNLIVQCICEIERRDLTKIHGLYRICGSDRTVKEWFLRLTKNVVSGKSHTLPQIGLSALEDPHCISGILKLFLRRLSEPLVTYAAWSSFSEIVEEFCPNENFMSTYKDSFQKISRQSSVRCVLVQDSGQYQLSYECCEKLLNVLDQLPLPNRDTMAYIMLHLKRVAINSPGMNYENLTKILSPTIVGNSAPNQDAITSIRESSIQQKILLLLLSLSNSVFENFLDMGDFLSLDEVRRSSNCHNIDIDPTLCELDISNCVSSTVPYRKYFKSILKERDSQND